MKKSLKIGLGILAGLGGAAVLAEVLRKEYKKTCARLNLEEEEVEKNLAEIGVSKATLEKLAPQEIEDSLMRSIFVGIIHNSNFIIDNIVKTEKQVDQTFKNSAIHLMMSQVKGKSFINFVFPLPNITEGGYKDPKIGDFLKTLSKTTAKQLWEDLKSPVQGFCNLELYACVDILDKETRTETIANRTYLIPKKLYSCFEEQCVDDEGKTKRRDGTVKYYTSLIPYIGYINGTDGDNIPDESLEPIIDKLEDYVLEQIQTEFPDCDMQSFEFDEEEGLFLSYRIAFPVQSGNSKHVDGVNYLSIISALNKLVNNCTIEKENCDGANPFNYDMIWVHGLYNDNDVNSSWNAHYVAEEDDGKEVIRTLLD